MIKWFNNRHNIYKYFICMFLLLSSLALVRIIFLSDYNFNYTISEHNIVEKRLINVENNNYKIYVNYPKFHDSEIDKIVSKYIYGYINKFKTQSKDKEYISTLSVNYEYYLTENYLNIYFSINNSLNNKEQNKNIIINTKTYKISKITDLYEKEMLTNKINTLVKSKYSSYIYDLTQKENVNNFIYNINEDIITVYFDSSKYPNINYTPFVNLSLSENTFDEEYNVEENKKIIALTFDDGPSEYTMDFVELLRLNNSKATFFMLGNRMKYKSEVVRAVYLSGNEVESHTYSHKNLTRISKNLILEEINSVTILFNQITNDNIKYLRPPYGSVNSKVKSLSPYPLIGWSIDPDDWLYRDAERVASHVINNAYDGAIILMHDVYPETLEAAKILIPQLKEMGYEFVTISDLIKYKNYELPMGKLVREIK